MLILIILSFIDSANANGLLTWHDDYFTAYREAKRDHKQLLIFFRDNKQKIVADSYQYITLTDEILFEPLKIMVRVVVPIDIKISNVGKLLNHPSFVYQKKRQGIAIIDLVDSKSNTYGTVISAHPFNYGRHLTVQSTKIVVELPSGTITQRSLIYAARVNLHRPSGVNGIATVKLLEFSKNHSNAMVRSGTMYHSNYPGSEIVAHAGEGTTIINTAKSFIDMWIGSPPHWAILSGNHHYFGLDMKCSKSGHWYATGIFN